MKTHIYITCPQCGHRELLRRPLLYDHLLLDEDPFIYTCPLCHHTKLIETPAIIYVQKHLIAFDPEGYHFSFIKDFLDDQEMTSVRLTTSLSSFVEKQLLLKNNYNDIAIEAYKQSISHMMHKQPILFYNDDPQDSLLNMTTTPIQAYPLSQTHYQRMLDNPLIHKLIAYDTPLSVDQNYINKISSRTITIATIKVNHELIQCIMPHYLEADLNDIALFEKNGSLHSGTILSFQEEDIFHISTSIKIKRIMTPDHDEDFLTLLQHVHDHQDHVEELISLMCRMYIYIPFQKEEPYYMNISPETVLPVFTKKESVHKCFPFATIVKTKLSTLLYLDIFECDGFLFNPQMDSLFFADHAFLTLLREYLQSPIC